MTRKPDFVIVGAMRSGTSSLAAYLDAHPEVFVTPRKEVHYFNRFFDRGFDWYLEQFAGAGDSLSVGEATPIYMCEQAPMDRLAADLPDARIIAILREPVARAYSHYWFNRARGHEPLPFDAALTAEDARLESTDEATRSRGSYFTRGLYVDQIERIYALFPRNQVHILLFEDLINHRKDTFADVCRFLGVDPEYDPPNAGRQINAYTARRWPWLHDASKRFPKPIRTALYLVNRKKSEAYSAISDVDAARLALQYEEPNRRLAKILGRDLAEWQSQ